MTTRTIAQIETASTEMVGANQVKRALPTRYLKQVDPFLFVDHLEPVIVNPNEPIRIPPHPHAGFEVVSYLLDGEFFHRDSEGNDQVAGAGDVNWMSSGSGIIHSEGPTESFLAKGGKLQLMQVWINTPADHKFDKASFRHYPASAFPVIQSEQSTVKVILGSFEGKTSPISTHTPMFYYHVWVKKNSLTIFPVDPTHSAAIYLMKGSIKVLNEPIKAGQLVDFQVDGDQLAFTATEDAEMIIIGGQPLKEKVVSYGPFVMNSFEEIQEAISNYETGKMGQLNY